MTPHSVRPVVGNVAVHRFGYAPRVRALLEAAGAHRPLVVSSLAMGLLLGLIRPFAA
jgi:hypothetical protein